MNRSNFIDENELENLRSKVENSENEKSRLVKKLDKKNEVMKILKEQNFILLDLAKFAEEDPSSLHLEDLDRTENLEEANLELRTKEKLLAKEISSLRFELSECEVKIMTTSSEKEDLVLEVNSHSLAIDRLATLNLKHKRDISRLTNGSEMINNMIEKSNDGQNTHGLGFGKDSSKFILRKPLMYDKHFMHKSRLKSLPQKILSLGQNQYR